jgi:subtilisin
MGAVGLATDSDSKGLWVHEMSSKAFFRIALGLLLILTIGGGAALASPPADRGPAQPKIVVFDDSLRNPAEQRAAISEAGGVPHRPLAIINAWSVSLPSAAQDRLEARADVLRIDDDVEVYALHHRPGHDGGPPGHGDDPDNGDDPPEEPDDPSQTTPWGVDRIHAPDAWNASSGEGVKVAILDTGIQLDHPDLVGNVQGGVTCISGRSPFSVPSCDPGGNDDNGHGTHVAGTVAALDNEIGVVGVAFDAELYSVKVLDRQGRGRLSDIIAGIEWSVENHMQIINMSLGTSSDVQSFEDAVDAAYAAGVLVVAAAGNSGDDGVAYPAAYDSVIAVAASCRDAESQYCSGTDAIASFSSKGPEVELTAPGVDVESTWIDGGYHNGSGTSMAAPHVAGVAALLWANEQSLSNEDVRARLVSTAEDLEHPESWQGHGLVRADQALGASD